MFQMNVLVVLLDSSFNGTTSLHNVNLTTFAWYAVQAWSLDSQVVFHRPKEASNLPWWEAHRLDDVPGQHLANATDGMLTMGRRAI
jgi:hypothetical protein